MQIRFVADSHQTEIDKSHVLTIDNILWIGQMAALPLFD